MASFLWIIAGMILLRTNNGAYVNKFRLQLRELRIPAWLGCFQDIIQLDQVEE